MCWPFCRLCLPSLFGCLPPPPEPQAPSPVEASGTVTPPHHPAPGVYWDTLQVVPMSGGRASGDRGGVASSSGALHGARAAVTGLPGSLHTPPIPLPGSHRSATGSGCLLSVSERGKLACRSRIRWERGEARKVICRTIGSGDWTSTLTGRFPCAPETTTKVICALLSLSFFPDRKCSEPIASPRPVRHLFRCVSAELPLRDHKLHGEPLNTQLRKTRQRILEQSSAAVGLSPK